MLKRSLSLLLILALAVSALNFASVTSYAYSEGNFKTDLEAKPITELFPSAMSTVSKVNTHIERLYDMETMNTLVYKNSDGTNTAYFFQENIKHVDSTGKIIDNTSRNSVQSATNVNIDGQDFIDDTCIIKNGDEPQGTSSSMVVGNFQGSIQRALIRLPGLYNDTAFTSIDENNIVEVKYNMYCSMGSGNTISAVYEYLGEWDENTVVYSDDIWNNCKVIPNSEKLYLETTSGFCAIDITALAKSWKRFQNGDVAAADPEKGFMYKLKDESNNNFAAFQTSENGAIPYNAYASVTYAPKVEIMRNGEAVDSISVNEGSIIDGLSVSHNTGNTSILWLSSDSSVATVSVDGTVTCKKAGKTTISALVYNGNTIDENTTIAQITIYVTIPDGVYSLKNLNSGRVIDVPNSTITPQTNVIQWAMYSATNSNQIWEITYIGEGKYFVQSGVYFDIGMSKTDSGYVCVDEVIKPKDITEIDENSIWTISYLSTVNSVSQYTFKCNGSNDCALTVENSSTSGNAKIVTDTLDSSNNSFYWSLVTRTNIPGTGIRFTSIPQVDGYNAIVAGEMEKVVVEVFPTQTNDFLIDWTTDPGYGIVMGDVEDFFTLCLYAEDDFVNVSTTLTASLRNNPSVSCSAVIDSIPVKHGIYYINTTINNSVKCIDARGGKATDKTEAILYSKNNPIGQNQVWTIKYAGNYKYYIASREEERYVISKDRPDDSTLVMLDVVGKPRSKSQKWGFVSTESGYMIQNESEMFLNAVQNETVINLYVNSQNSGTIFTLSEAGESLLPDIAVLDEWQDEQGELWLCNNSIVTFKDVVNTPKSNIWDSDDYDKIKFNINNISDLEVVVFYGDNGKVTVSSESIGNAVGENKPARDTKTFNITPIPDNVQSGLKVVIDGQNKYLSRSVVNSNMVLVDELLTKYKFEYISEGYYAIVTPENYALTVSLDRLYHTLLGEVATERQLWRIEKASSGYVLRPKIQLDYSLAIVDGTLQLSDTAFDGWQITMIDYHLTMVDETDRRDRMSGYIEGIRVASNGIAYNFVYHDEITSSEFVSLLGTTTGVVMIRTHGTSENEILTAENYGLNAMPSSAIQNVTAGAVIYGSCYGGIGEGENANNFVNVSINNGANCAFGFTTTVLSTEANDLAYFFTKYTSEGKSYEEAIWTMLEYDIVAPSYYLINAE